jgi:peptidoglycan/LPS O-acetylase OafA/YrhL
MTASTPCAAARPRALAYVPGLDGLRGAAVLAVLLFHAGLSWLPGGFLGVDAFFVLSGYLITTLLLAPGSGDVRRDLRSFWDRRARRLVPALAALAFGVVALGFLTPVDAAPRDALGALTYLANWRLIATGGGYFGGFAAPSAFKHTWSLAVEGQFYLFWPLLVVLLCRRSRRWVLVVAGSGALASAAAMAASFRPYGDPARAYYGTDTRVQALFVGAALAVVLSARTATLPRRAFLSASGAIGAAYTLLLWHSASGSTGRLYHGGFLLAAVATAAVVASVVAVPGGPLARALAVRPLVLVGRVSYGIYLWHWPVYLLLTHERTHLPGLALLAARLAVTGGLAALSWFFVEVPARTWSPRPRVLTRRLGYALGALVLLGATTTWVRTPPRTTAVASAEPGGAGPADSDVVLPSLVPTPAARRTPGPPLEPAATPPAVHRRAPTGTGRVMFIGDSVAETLASGLRDADGLDIVNEGILGCGLTVGGPYRYFGGQYDDLPKCAQWPATWRAALDRDRPDLAVLLVGRWECMDRRHDGQWMHLGMPAYDAYVDAQLDAAIALLGSTGARVAVMSAPYYKRGERPDGGRWPEDDPARVDRYNAILRGVLARHPGVHLVDLHAALAPQGVFTKRINGTLVRYDGVHISGSGARLLTPWLYPELKSALAG